jgi:hypothetical protein
VLPELRTATSNLAPPLRGAFLWGRQRRQEAIVNRLA